MQIRYTVRGFVAALFLFLSGSVILMLSYPMQCKADACPQPAAYGRQPFPTEMKDTFLKAGINLLGNKGPTLPQVWKGYPPAQAKLVSPYAPCILLEAIGHTESVGWYQFNSSYGQSGNTVIAPDCGYGIMQITSGMGGGQGFDPGRVAAEPAYNIGTGALLLMQKWNSLNYYIGDNNPAVVDDWYYAVWAYSSWGFINNPNNPSFNASRPPFNGTQNRSWYPYQEIVWGYAANPPSYQGTPFWKAIPLTLPNRTLMTNPPPILIARPMPSHSSCGIGYLPAIINNYPACAKPIQNSNFESGSAFWTLGGRTVISTQQHASCFYSAWLGGLNNSDDILYQTIAIPPYGPTGGSVVSALLNFNWFMTTEETFHPYDYLYVKIRNANGTDIATLQIINDGNTANVWNQSSFDLSAYIGQTIQVYFRGTTDSSYPTSFFC